MSAAAVDIAVAGGGAVTVTVALQVLEPPAPTICIHAALGAQYQSDVIELNSEFMGIGMHW